MGRTPKMKNRGTRALAILGLVCLALVLSASPIAAAGGNGNGNGNSNGNGNGNGNGNDPPVLSATPELDSLALFGAGAAGLVGYTLLRLRAGRRQDKETD